MPQFSRERAIYLDAVSAPFFQAVGRTMARWQYVEAGLCILAHAILGTDYRYSSTVFFHIKSPDSKVQLLDRLCREHFSEEVLKAEWTPLLTDLNEGVQFRNVLAHFEASWVLDTSILQPGEPPLVLTPHHLDPRMAKNGKVRAATMRTLQQAAEAYTTVAHRLFGLVRKHFPLEGLRATNLPPRLLQFLERLPADPPVPPPPPSPSEPSQPNRRERRKAARDQRRRK